MVDDAQAEEYRQPSHSDLAYEIERVGLRNCDPNREGKPVGKAKRIRAVLGWALENDFLSGQTLVSNLISHLRGCGGFRVDSPNFVGRDPIQNAISAFRGEGFELSSTGELHPLVLEALQGAELTAALRAYSLRAKRGAEDAALVTGTSKDLLEATAAHIITERSGGYPTTANFPTLLGQAFIQLGFATPDDRDPSQKSPQERLQIAMYETARAVNHLRNKEGTGHGRPWLPGVTDDQARVAVELMGAIAEHMLSVHLSQQ